jgi:pyridoxamine 5'-phosphate oxidase
MANNLNISSLRRSYSLKELDENSVFADPIEQFAVWMKETIDSQLLEPNAMILSTTEKNGIPASRTVLLKEFDKAGFVFFTNYESDKSKQMKQNPNAALLFLWTELERQIRITGKVEVVNKQESKKYFHSRPRESQLGAWASKQSSVLENRGILIKRFEEAREKFEGKEIPLPPFWGGFRLIPNKIEFWQGRENRLHDRIRYRLENKKWIIERLSP